MLFKISCVNVVSRIPKEIEQNYGKSNTLSQREKPQRYLSFIEEEKIQESI